MRHTMLMFAFVGSLACTPCFAQLAAGGVEATMASTADAHAAPAQPDADTPPKSTPPKSPFGRVMAVMIAALVQDSTHQQAVATDDNAATSLPIRVEVGEAFRADLAAAAAPRPQMAAGRTTARVSAEAVPAQPEALALQAALANDGL